MPKIKAPTAKSPPLDPHFRVAFARELRPLPDNKSGPTAVGICFNANGWLKPKTLLQAAQLAAKGHTPSSAADRVFEWALGLPAGPRREMLMQVAKTSPIPRSPG